MTVYYKKIKSYLTRFGSIKRNPCKNNKKLLYGRTECGPRRGAVQVEMRGGTIKCGFLRLYGNKLRLGAFAARQEMSFLPYQGYVEIDKHIHNICTLKQILLKYIQTF